MNRIFRPRQLALLILPAALIAIRSAAAAESKPPATQPSAKKVPDKQFLVTYTIAGKPDEWPPGKRKEVEEAMDEALRMYNTYGTFDKKVTAKYNADTPTADGSFNGNIRFGKSLNSRTALHELGHCMGVGTAPAWKKLVKDGIWIGPAATAMIKAFDGPDAVLHADGKHFWPYGLNYAKEDTPLARIRHVKMVEALREDMGIRNGK